MRRREQQLLILFLLSQNVNGFGPQTLHPAQSEHRPRRVGRRPRINPLPASGNSDGANRNNRGFGKTESSRSKHRAISALSQRKTPSQGQKNDEESILPPSSKSAGNATTGNRKQKRAHMKRRDETARNGEMAKSSFSRHGRKGRDKMRSQETISSLLPPPLKDTIASVDDEELSPGLSSWDDFLSGARPTPPMTGGTTHAGATPSGSPAPAKSKNDANLHGKSTQNLPSIDDLFPSTSNAASKEQPKNGQKAKSAAPPKKSLDGVLPVSDLFFRASAVPRRNLNTDGTDPLSASNASHTEASLAEMAKTGPTRKKSGRKMVRRGMEMLVGGRPVNADPPLRSLEIFFNPGASDWASTILLNSREFGPLLHVDSVDKVSRKERGLFCEYFVNSALKWDVCPPDLRDIAKTHAIQREKSLVAEKETAARAIQEIARTSFDSEPALNGRIRTHDEEDEEDGMLTIQVKTAQDMDMNHKHESDKIVSYDFGGAIFEFDVGLSESDLQNGDPDYEVLKSILVAGVMGALKDELQGFDVEISHFAAKPIDPERTSVSAEFNMKCVQLDDPVDYDDIEKKAIKVMAAFADAVEGDLGLALAESALKEHRWPKRVRETFVEECLDADEDEVEQEDSEEQNDLLIRAEGFSDFSCLDGPFDKKAVYSNDDLYLGNGNDGVFYDHSESNILQAPYSGRLGLRLVDAVVERAKQRQPRVIAVGDVHGCIDELQDLLRQCDYRPGDLVVFLGDLVCKGPDSTSVVQMAREIGAIGVRGNHDFEVIRWHQAIKSGVDPPIVRSEHYHVASCLSKADIKWMYSLPWFMSSKDLGALFVHAGFVSGVRLAKQNPRLMMNMRSILPDGTVTSKFFNNWPWARLWDGPQTVLFGHDADRGLQQYEHAIGLDTGCVYGGRLTACILPERRLVSVSARREYFKYRRKKYD